MNLEKPNRINGRRRIKIMLLIDNLACGGKERRLISLLKRLLKMEFIHCDLVLVDDEIFYDEVKNLDVRTYILKRAVKHDPIIFIKLFRLCKKLQPDIIHSWGSMPSIYAVPAAKLLGIKLMNAEIANAPNNLTFENKIRTKFTFQFSDLVVANSRRGLASYNAPQTKSVCIYNGFDFDRIKELQPKELIRRKFHITTKYVVGMVSAIYPKKDYVTYLLAAMEISKKRNDITFLVVGDGAMLTKYKELTRNYTSIIYTGSQNGVESIINIFDVAVLSTNSKLHGEGISNSILEYMALAKPVIASAGGGTDEIIEDGINGLLYQSQNPDQLEEKILFLFNNPQTAIRLGQEGYNTVSQKFSLENMVRSTLLQYYVLSGVFLKDFEKSGRKSGKKIKPEIQIGK